MDGSNLCSQRGNITQINRLCHQFYKLYIFQMFALVYPQHSIYMDCFRECYEGYVIYNFMMYLLNYLNLEMDLEATLELKPPLKHLFPLCFMKPWEMGREFIHNCKHGILQYAVIRPITTFISVYVDHLNAKIKKKSL